MKIKRRPKVLGSKKVYKLFPNFIGSGTDRERPEAGGAEFAFILSGP